MLYFASPLDAFQIYEVFVHILFHYGEKIEGINFGPFHEGLVVGQGQHKPEIYDQRSG